MHKDLEGLRQILDRIGKGDFPEKISSNISLYKEISQLLTLMKNIQRSILEISSGVLDKKLPFEGPLETVLKALQANMRLLYKEAGLSDEIIGDENFIGEFYESFNSMLFALNETQEKLAQSNKQLAKLNREYEEDLLMAEKAQSSMMKSIKGVPFLEKQFLWQPCQGVSGDFFHEYLDPTGSYNVFLGDATGHGVSAGLITMVARAALESIPRTMVSTCEILQKLNSILFSCLPDERFITGAFMRVCRCGKVFYSIAGHPPIILLRNETKEILTFKGTGMALGMFEDEIEPYEESIFQMEKGDKLFIYTDGATEQSNGSEQFGQDRLISAIRQQHSKSLPEILSHIEQEVRSFGNDSPLEDDLTIISIEFFG
jgi:serine phosphatase RsbU (regulator of sigma subunit)